jgi:hypothetical protein
METSSRLTIPSALLKKLCLEPGHSVQARLEDLLELPVPLNEEWRKAIRLPTLPMGDLVTMQVFLCMGKVEAITPLWSLKHLELFQDSFGDSSLLPILLESIVDELCQDTDLVPQLSDFLQTEGTVSSDGISGWITGSQVQTFLFRISDIRKTWTESSSSPRNTNNL